MLEYEWAANPSAMMLDQEGSEEAAPAQPDYPTRQVFDHYSAAAHHHQLQLPPQPHSSSALFPCSQTTSFFDPRGATYPPHHHSFLSLDQISSANNNNPYFGLVPKSEEVGDPHHLSSRMGLNLGGRTYFSSAEDDFVSRLYRRSLDPGGGGGASNPPRCQAEGCTADLTHAKHYHRRHKVCEFHSKASTVVAAGLTQRFCQQCSRFHVLTEFDNGKRSCRKRLADHNRRRRKSHQNAVNTLQQSQEAAAALKETGPADDSPSHNLTTARSPSDSGVQSSSSVTVAVSPPRMFLDCFKQRPYHQGTAASSSSSASSSSLFFLSG
ncbi:unnamed protein product [Linum trigynum]|uniref:SBP-type domain-containing protein n=1 Tax=Linum trigynum TaxID=586398 RepID=A0AAV2CY86_9ROSI